MTNRFVVLTRLVVLGTVATCSALDADERPRRDQRPNIIVTVVDDMGFSDLGCYGGEVVTPRLDRLAREGLRFTQFYNCAKCETTRATLLSGKYHPEVGIGQLRNCTTIAEAMRQQGYATLMSGKWHMTGNPVERGFDRYFGHLSGATNFFVGNDSFRIDDQPFDVPQSGFYTTDAFTDYAIEFLRGAPQDKPFFLYLAYNAPHYPLQAPREDVEKYRGRYRGGWDKLRIDRFARIREMGLLPDTAKLSPRPDDVPAWDTLSAEQQEIEELTMATYAAMIDRVDQNMGRLIDYLKETGQFDNTLILFFSDNGACPFQRTTKKTLDEKLMPWDPQSYWTYDKGWAHACNTPFREYKRNQHEGGINTPMIAHWPAGIRQPGRIVRQPSHLVDVMATSLDLGRRGALPELPGLRGQSLRPLFEADGSDTSDKPSRDPLYFTFYGTHNAYRQGDWKLVNIDNGEWELYNLADDRSETKDVSRQHPQVLRELVAEFTRLHEAIGGGRRGNKSGSNKDGGNLRNPRQTGTKRRMLLADYQKKRLAIVGAANRLQFEQPIRDIHDAQVLPNGNVLFQTTFRNVLEMNAAGEIVWKYEVPVEPKVEIHSFRRLPNGLTMIAESGARRIIEVDREGKTIHEIPLRVDNPDPHRDTRLVRPTPAGNYVVAHEGDQVIREYDRQGKVVWEYKVGHRLYSAVPLKNGNTLVGCGDGRKVIEVDRDGKIVWSVESADLADVELQWITMVQRLSNGNTLIVNCHAGPENPQVLEVTPEKEVVWTFKDFDRFGNALPVALPLTRQ